MKRNLTMAAIIAALILSPMFLNPLVIKADDNSIGSLSSVDNPDGSPNSSSNTADESITVNGSDNSGSNGELVLQTCGGYLYIDGSYYGDFFGSLQSFSVGTTGLLNGFHYVSVQPNNNCGGGGAATGTNSVDFYIQHVPAQQTCSLSVSRNINHGQAPGATFTSANYTYALFSTNEQVGAVNGDYNYSGLTPGNIYTIISTVSVDVNYQGNTFKASGFNSVMCPTPTTQNPNPSSDLILPYITQASLKLGQ